VYDFLTQFCGRTMDPEEADFFYLPVIRDVWITNSRIILLRLDRDSIHIVSLFLFRVRLNTGSPWVKATAAPVIQKWPCSV
jgi:hypothetical protein